MKKSTLLVWSGLVALAAVAPAPASAQAQTQKDFNITIPVRLANLPTSIYELNVNCWVFVPPAGVTQPATFYVGTTIAMGGASQTITGGSFTGNVLVSFNAPQGVNPATATHYYCNGGLLGSERGSPTNYLVNGSNDGTLPLAAGAPFNLVTGVHPLH